MRESYLHRDRTNNLDSLAYAANVTRVESCLSQNHG